MSAFDKIITKLNTEIQMLAQNGGNKNGKIDTIKEDQELAKLLSGAEEEVADLFNKYLEDSLSEDAQSKLVEECGSALLKISELKTSMLERMKGYQSSLLSKMKATLSGKDDIPDKAVENDNVFKVRSDNSYEERLSEQENSYNVVVRNKDGQEIGRKSYTKSKQSIYTNKDFVAKNCGLYTKNNIDDIKTGAVKRFFITLITLPLIGDRAFDDEDSLVSMLKGLNDDEAVDTNSGLLYKWNPETYEYEKVGNISSGYYDQHNFSHKSWGEKVYDAAPQNAENQ